MRQLLPQHRAILSLFALLFGGLFVGMLMSVRPQVALSSSSSSRNSSASLSVDRIGTLREHQQELNAELSRLRDEQAELQQQSTSSQSNFEEIRTQIDQQQQMAALVAMRGPGVVVTLNDSNANSLPDEVADVNRYIIHQQRLVPLVGVLWSNGAEAISINDQRIPDQPSIYCVGSTILINQELMAPPFTIRAIGDPNTLANAASNSPLLSDLWNRQREFGIGVDVKQKAQVQVPAYTGPLANRHLEVAP